MKEFGDLEPGWPSPWAVMNSSEIYTNQKPDARRGMIWEYTRILVEDGLLSTTEACKIVFGIRASHLKNNERIVSPAWKSELTTNYTLLRSWRLVEILCDTLLAGTVDLDWEPRPEPEPRSWSQKPGQATDTHWWIRLDWSNGQCQCISDSVCWKYLKLVCLFIRSVQVCL